MNFLFLMDPLETVKVHSDTSFIFMMGAHDRGHKVFYLPSGGISLKTGLVHFKVTEIVPVVQVDDCTIGDGKPGSVTRKLSEKFHQMTRQL